MVFVVLLGGGDDLEGFFSAVDEVHLDVRFLTGNHLVGGKVVLQALGLDVGQVGNVVNASPDIVAFQHRHNLVVGFTAVDHLDAAYYTRIEHDVGAGDVALREYADIQRIAIGLLHVRAALGHFLGAVGAGDKAVQGGGAGGGALGAVHDQEARSLVQLVLHHVVGSHLHVDLHDIFRCLFGPGVQTVPGVAAPTVEPTIAVHNAYLETCFTMEARIVQRKGGKISPHRGKYCRVWALFD